MQHHVNLEQPQRTFFISKLYMHILFTALREQEFEASLVYEESSRIAMAAT